MPGQRWLSAITAVFVTSLIVSNIIAVKLIYVVPFFLPAGILTFPKKNLLLVFGLILPLRSRRVLR